jgi:two-component system, NarL family, nitrate/nitrite response regulator NarL
MLVEDHPGYRQTINLALEAEPDIELVSEFGTAERALRSVHDRETHKSPNVILLDLNLPGITGLNALPAFHQSFPEAKILILTQSDRESDVLRAIEQGASGYLLKSASLANITEGIRTVINGGASLDPKVARFILENLQGSLPRNATKPVLTDREMEVLTLLAEGLVKKEIADKLNIGFSTVATHVLHIYEKLNEPNAPAAIHRAHVLGLFRRGDRK